MLSTRPSSSLFRPTAAAFAAAVFLSACAQFPVGGGAAGGAAPVPSAGAAGAGSAASAASAPTRSTSAAASAVRPAGAASGAASTSPAPSASTAAPAANPLPTFASVIKDAKRIEGPVVAWQKEDKVWLELSDKDFNVPFFLSPKIAGGIGEGGVLGGLMGGRTGAGGARWVEFRRLYNQVQLIARNAEYAVRPGTAGTPAARSVGAAFSPSLVGSTGVASQPHPERKTVLIDATGLFMADMMGLGAHLQRTYRQGYSLDGRNSAITAVRGKPDVLVVEVQSHFATGSLAAAAPGTAPGAAPSVPATLPDPRSLFVQQHYSLSRLPAEPMAARRADARIGHFITAYNDFSDDLARNPRQRFINRWRLEKKDPAAELSEPVRPITYWIDRSVPERYREPITAGILEWNKAFEKVGFRNAIVVKVQPDNADFDTLDTGIASVRWMTNATAMFGAVGPSHVDPRSGEILDADIAIESLSSRAIRTIRSQLLARPGMDDWLNLMQAGDAVRDRTALGMTAPMTTPYAVEGLGSHRHDAACAHADQSAEQLGYALDVLEARDGLDPAGPEAQAFVMAYLKDVTMHEVGHTLGLRHNFRASRLYSEAQLSDPDFTRTHALTGSVMEYAPINLAAPGQPEVTPFQTTLGPYDYWAIEYAYRVLPKDAEAAELARIAGRSGEAELAYGTDEDNLFGLDPETQQGDLGRDPVAFARKRFAIARDLLKRLEVRQLQPDSEYASLRRGVSYALRDVARVTGTLLREIGGVRTLRDAPNTGRDPLQPVPALRQREALDALAGGVLAADSLVVSPGLQRRLAPDYLERSDALFAVGVAPVNTDYAPQQQLSDLQRGVLAQLMSDGVATRLLDSADKASSADQSLPLADLYRRIDTEVWSELAGPHRDIPALRRVLQRDHAVRLSQALLQPAQAGRVQLRTLQRVQARELLARLNAVRYRSGWSPEAVAHFDDCIQVLKEALDAKVVRPSV